MVDKEINDIFKDFKYKEEPSHKEFKSRAQKDFDKRRFEEPEEGVKEEVNELREQVRELKKYIKGKGLIKEPKERVGVMRIKELKSEPKFNLLKAGPGALERGVLIGIIVLLIAFIVIDLSSYHNKSSGREAERTIGSDVGKAVNESAQNITPEVVEEAAVEENKTEEATEEENKTEEADEEKELSGKITLKIKSITEKLRSDIDDDTGEISKISFIIDNGQDKVLTPVVNAYVYDSETKDPYETKSRGQYTFSGGISAGSTHTGAIDLNPKIYKKLDLKKQVRLALNDTEEGFITAVNDEIFIS